IVAYELDVSNMRRYSSVNILFLFFFFFQAEDGIRDRTVTGVQTCALPILFFVLLTLSAMGYSLLCMLSGVSFLLSGGLRRNRFAVASRPIPVSILKPLKGRDPQMYESFRSHCLQEYPEFEIIFGVDSADDEAAPLVEQLRREFPQQQIRLVVCGKKLGANGKVSSIVQMLEHARYGHILINDGDIRVAPGYLSQVMVNFGSAATPRSEKPVGMVTCLYRAVAGRTSW